MKYKFLRLFLSVLLCSSAWAAIISTGFAHAQAPVPKTALSLTDQLSVRITELQNMQERAPGSGGTLDGAIAELIVQKASLQTGKPVTPADERKALALVQFKSAVLKVIARAGKSSTKLISELDALTSMDDSARIRAIGDALRAIK